MKDVVSLCERNWYMNVKVLFDVAELPFSLAAVRDGVKTLEITACDGVLTVSVPFDYKEEPLKLQCEIQAGDRVAVVLMPHRIELYVGGVLMDEEWPAGTGLFAIEDAFSPAGVASVSFVSVTEPKEEPSVLGEIENAEGWYPGNGVFVGDCMPYRRDDEFHVLYLKDRHHHMSKWGLGAHQWEHISTKDFRTWSIHPMAVPITEPWEGSICTGSWVRHEGKEYLYYTIRQVDGSKACIRRSVSHDGYHFVKDTSFGFTLSDKYVGRSARDPKVIKDDQGVYHMFLTTALAREGKGCLAHCISYDMETWTECDQPLYVAPNEDYPECPDYFFYRGKYYLMFSFRGTAQYLLSDKPFEGFVSPEDPVIPCSMVPKCAPWQDKLVFVGYRLMGGYAGCMTFLSATADKDGRLIFETKE